MRLSTLLRALSAAALLAGCASNYQDGVKLGGGGYSEQDVGAAVWRVTFQGNQNTRMETIQTYWLYRCAELTLDKGFAGFEVVSNIRLAGARVDEPGDHPLLHRVRGGGIIIVPIYGGSGAMPSLTADIRMIAKPFEPAPPKLFDAVALKATLDPFVHGKKCDSNNVCPHPHTYLGTDGAGPVDQNVPPRIPEKSS